MKTVYHDFLELEKLVPQLVGDEAEDKVRIGEPTYMHVCSPEMLPTIAKYGLLPSRQVHKRIASGEFPKTNVGMFYGYFGEDSSVFPDSVCLTSKYAPDVALLVDVL